MKIRDVMTDAVATVSPETTLHEVAQVLTDRRVSGLPVVTDDGMCVGVISEADLIVKQAGRQTSRRRPLDWILGESPDPEQQRRRAATTAREAMSSPVFTVEADRPLRDAADRMVASHVNRLPVVDNGRLVGIVTRADLVRAYLHMDEEIEHAIRDDLLDHTMWLDPSRFQINVSEGHVTIRGIVDRRSTATIVAKLIGLLDGVAEVTSDLTWELDDSKFEPATAGEREPGAASIASRERPRANHR